MHMRYITLAVAIAALTIGQVAGAVEEVGQAYVTPMGAAIIGDHDRTTEDGVKGALLGIGYAIEKNWNVELQAQYLSLDGKNGGPSGHQTGFTANALNIYNRGGMVEPYLIGGVGMVSQHNPDSRDSGNFQAQAGLGLMATIIQHRLGVRAEALWRLDDTSSSFNDVLFHFGFQVPIGGPKAAATAAAAPVAAAAAAPAAAPAAAVVAPAAAVAAVEVDSDGDGVPDSRDKCPGTPKGVKVDADGCGVSVVLEGVNFDNDSAKLKPESYAILDKAVAALKTRSDIKVEVQGHTDNNASADHNLKLSQKRAEAVRDYLVKNGIAASRLTAKGYGLTQPIADNATPEGRAKNRRVVLNAVK